jgi:RNA polymerase sigma factor (sigma-70 family)
MAAMIEALRRSATAFALAPLPGARAEAEPPRIRATVAVAPLPGREVVEQLYRSHGHLVLRRARALLGNEADAQEALQEVFAGLLRAPAQLAGVRSRVGWLYAATTHHCLNVLRDRRTGARLIELQVAPATTAVGCARADALAEARSLIARLPEEVATAAVYHHVDGMTYDEIAAQLGCSRRKVGYLLEHALRAAAAVEVGDAEPAA